MEKKENTMTAEELEQAWMDGTIVMYGSVSKEWFKENVLNMHVVERALALKHRNPLEDATEMTKTALKHVKERLTKGYNLYGDEKRWLDKLNLCLNQELYPNKMGEYEPQKQQLLKDGAVIYGWILE